MTKIIYNRCYGGFSLSNAAIKRYKRLGGRQETQGQGRNIPRDDQILARVVEELGKRANGAYAELAIKELTPGTKWRIDEYDGNENVMTPDDYKWNTA